MYCLFDQVNYHLTEKMYSVFTAPFRSIKAHVLPCSPVSSQFSRCICYTIRKGCAAAMTLPQLFAMSIDKTDSQYPLLVRAAPVILHILDGIEMLHNDPELITFLRSLARDGAQQSPIQSQAPSMDDQAMGRGQGLVIILAGGTCSPVVHVLLSK